MNLERAYVSMARPLLAALCYSLASARLAAASVVNQAAGNSTAAPTGADPPTPMTDIHDIKPALAFDAPWPWWMWLIVALTVAFLIALTWWLRRQHGQKNATVESIPALPPEVEAIQKLDALAAGQSRDPKHYYFSLSAVLRHYVERRFDFPAAEMTTEELLPRIRKLSMTDNLVQAFKHFCLNSDPIKFADAVADQDRMHQDMTFARQFIEQTTAAVEPTAAGESNKTAVTTLENNP